MSDSRLYGIHAVKSILEHSADQLQSISVLAETSNRRLIQIISIAQKKGVVIHPVSAHELDLMAPDTKHQGIIAQLNKVRAQPGETELYQFVQALAHAPFMLILDGVQDPHNLGACLRTADGAGVDAVVIPKNRATGITSTVRKVACGAAETVPVFQVTNLARVLKKFSQLGVWIVGLDGDAEKTLYQIDLKGPLAIALGAEGTGLRRLTLEHCDFVANIPMQGSVQSLNVSVVTGIALFEAIRQRSG